MQRTYPEPRSYNHMPNLVRGQWYEFTIWGGSAFRFWSERKLKRAEAKLAAREFAGEEVYEADDIDRVIAVREEA